MGLQGEPTLTSLQGRSWPAGGRWAHTECRAAQEQVQWQAWSFISYAIISHPPISPNTTRHSGSVDRSSFRTSEFFSFLKVRFRGICYLGRIFTIIMRKPKISVRLTTLLMYIICLLSLNPYDYSPSIWRVLVSASHWDPLSYSPFGILLLDSGGQCVVCWYSAHNSPEVSTQRFFDNVWMIFSVTVKDRTSTLASVIREIQSCHTLLTVARQNRNVICNCKCW
jgi:hypothetical protein